MKNKFLLIVFFFFIISLLTAQDLKMASGWSVDDNETAAVKEAFAKMNKSIKNPNFIVLFTCQGYNTEKLVAEINKLAKGTKIFGMEVAYAVFTQDGLHKGKKSALALMGFEGRNLKIGVGGTAITAGKVKENVFNAINNARRDAGKTKKDAPSFVIIGSSKGHDEEIVKIVENEFGKNTKIIGGTAVKDNEVIGNVIANNSVYHGGFSIALIYADTKIGASFHSGFTGKTESGVVTETDGKIIKTIDNKPAFDVYNKWSGGAYDKVDVKKSPEIWQIANAMPLAKAIKSKNGEITYVVSIPIIVYPDKSMLMGVTVNKGETIWYVTGGSDAMIKRAGAVVNKAMLNGRIKKESMIGGIQYYCNGAAMANVGVARLPEIVAEIKKSMGSKPFIGGFVGGEQGSIPGFGCFHFNLTSSMVVFSNE